MCLISMKLSKWALNFDVQNIKWDQLFSSAIFLSPLPSSSLPHMHTQHTLRNKTHTHTHTSNITDSLPLPEFALVDTQNGAKGNCYRLILHK